LLEVVAVEHVVRVEGDEASRIGVGDVDAGLLDRAEIEALRIDELHDEDTEEVFVAAAGEGEELLPVKGAGGSFFQQTEDAAAEQSG
jgi:hypothetical protein